MIAAAWARLQGWLALAGTLLVTLGTAYLAGRRDGHDSRGADAARRPLTTWQR